MPKSDTNVAPRVTIPLSYMTTGHLPPALLAIYTEILPHRADLS
jgi:hypothetical protein